MSFLGCKFECQSLHSDSPPRATKISTTTSTARICTGIQRVDHKALYEYVVSNRPCKTNDTGATIVDVKRNKFAGQTTLVVQTGGRLINIFVFHTGSLKLTGVDHPRTGVRATRAVLDVCRSAGVLTHPLVSRVQLYKTVCINSSYKLNYEVDRTTLFRILLEQYGLLTIYDSTNYPGVIIKYFYNVVNDKCDGLCHCYDGSGENKECKSVKGDGCSRFACRRITATVFRSGTIILTGARNYTQLRQVFDCVTRICKLHREMIEVPVFDLLPTDELKETIA